MFYFNFKTMMLSGLYDIISLDLAYFVNSDTGMNHIFSQLHNNTEGCCGNQRHA